MKKSTLIGGIIVFSLLLMGGCTAGTFYVVTKMIFESEPVVLVVKQLETYSEVTDVTGTPIELHIWGGNININSSGSGGFAGMDTTAYGPQGNQRFVAQVRKDKGEWEILYLAIYPGGKKIVKIDPSVDQTGDKINDQPVE